MRHVLHPVFAVGLAAYMACHPAKVPSPTPAEAYAAKVAACAAAAKTPQESCECRKSVDQEFGVCDHPEWPAIGRCDVDCSQVK